MSIVAISETAGSLGNEIGGKVAEMLGYVFADREIIAKAAEQYGENVMNLRHGTEEKPTLWERLTDTQHRYMIYVEAIMFEMAARDNVVLAGRASTIVLRRVPHTLRVRTVASEGVRAQRVQHQQGLTHEAALDHVRQTDHERAARVKFLYHVDVDDPFLYDIVLNTERLTVERGARLVRETLQDVRFQSTADSRRAVMDLSVATRARAALVASPLLGSRRLFVSCKDGHVTLTGSVREDEERQAAQEAVTAIPGVAGVLNEIVVTYSGRITTASM